MYKGTIRDNLKYGLKREITEEEFRNACRETFVDQFVSTLPDGYQTVISNEMSSLSAGEKQLFDDLQGISCETEYSHFG